MSYTFQISVPPNTTEENAVTQTVKFPPCTVDAIALVIPRGHSFLTETWFSYQSTKILPANPEYNYKGNGVLIPIRPNLLVIEEPLELTMHSFNLDEKLPHTTYAYCEITIITDKLTIHLDALQRLLGNSVIGGREQE